MTAVISTERTGSIEPGEWLRHNAPEPLQEFHVGDETIQVRAKDRVVSVYIPDDALRMGMMLIIKDNAGVLYAADYIEISSERANFWDTVGHWYDAFSFDRFLLSPYGDVKRPEQSLDHPIAQALGQFFPEMFRNCRSPVMTPIFPLNGYICQQILLDESLLVIDYLPQRQALREALKHNKVERLIVQSYFQGIMELSKIPPQWGTGKARFSP